MAEVDIVRKAFERSFGDVRDLGDGVLRGERRYLDKPYVVGFIDLADDVVKRAGELDRYQQRLLGERFFSQEGDLRWNSYLYLWAGPNSRSSAQFERARKEIESDRHYARKFVVTAADLDRRFADVGAPDASQPAVSDIGATWAQFLRSASLGVLLEQRPRTRVLDLIATGEAFVAEGLSADRSTAELVDPLTQGRLRSLTVSNFRPVLAGKVFSFGDVNLIVGPNGAGKTSLLESIEGLYCGRTRRDPDADIAGIEALVQLPSGVSAKVVSTSVAATLKARNLAWYGRSDPQSHSILQGFSRFNFLDTDAAFRLSSETDNDSIRLDLSRLLVGPEAAKLWTYLFKLQEDLGSRRSLTNESAKTLRKQVELCAAEVKRIQETPSEYNALAQSLRSTLMALGAKWLGSSDASARDLVDRTRLEWLTRGLTQAMSQLTVSPVTIEKLHERRSVLYSAVAKARSILADYTTKSESVPALQKEHQAARASVKALEAWLNYCRAGVPALAVARQQIASDIARFGATLAGAAPDADIPPEYLSQPLVNALRDARSALQAAEQQERVALSNQEKSELLGRTIASLRRDLHDVARTLIQRSGDSSHCPICFTAFPPAELLTKIDALTSSNPIEEGSGLRQAVLVAKERAEDARRRLSALRALDAFRVTTEVPEQTTVEVVREQVRSREQQVRSLQTELGRIDSAARAWAQEGLDWTGYDAAHSHVEGMLATAGDAQDPKIVENALNARRGVLSEKEQSLTAARADLQGMADALRTLLGEVGLEMPTDATLGKVVSKIERAAGAMDGTITFLREAREQIRIAGDQPLEDLGSAIDTAILLLDRVVHAYRTEHAARTELAAKTEELGRIQVALDKSLAELANYQRAGSTLDTVVLEYSLDRATKDALESIRGRTSDIFARIHTPAEYELGDFSSAAPLLTRKGQIQRRIGQISTGQRAALALSIFLALNASAASAPPVMLIDDPVAHIDDLNALSFLDYLRDLVLRSRNQIFFATADARLAALFERKFEFLGSDRYRRTILQLEGSG